MIKSFKVLTFFLLSIAVASVPFSVRAVAPLPQVTNVSVGVSSTAPYHNGNMTVSWTGIAEALQYTVRASQVGTNTAPYVTVGKESNKAVIEGLTGGATYVVQVRVIGDGNASDWTSASLTATPITLPMAPAQPSPPTPGVGSALVSWSDLSGDQDGGSPVTGYSVTEILSNTTLLVGPTDSSATITGLSEGGSASFTVAAITSVSPKGVASVATSAITILTSKTSSSTSSTSKSAASQTSSGGTSSGGGGGGVGGGMTAPSSSPTPTISPTSSPTPTQTAIPLPSLTAQPTHPALPSATPSTLPSASPTPTPSPSPSASAYSLASNPFFKVESSKVKVFVTVSLKNSKQNFQATLGKSLKIVLPKVAKGTLVKATMKFPDSKTLLLFSNKTSKVSDVPSPIISFKRAGTYILTTVVGKITRTLTIKVSSPPKVVTITCVNGKLSTKISAAKPVCPKGYKQK